MSNQLYYGDNLDILRLHIKDESVDLVYLDPPFNSDASYNILFKENSDGSKAAAQIKAFEDTWRWDMTAARLYKETVDVGGEVSKAIRAFHSLLGPSNMMAYVVMMAPRLLELRRVMKPSASIYLHCDPTASHYLKLLMDSVFGAENFKNEIVWRRSHPKGHAFTRLASTHDVIFSYTKNAEKAFWSPVYLPHDPKNAAKQYSLKDENGRRYQLTSLLNPNPDRPNLTYEFKGVTKVWRWTKERMMEADAQGFIVVPKGGKGIPRFKRYLDEQEGLPLGDWWGDIEIASGSERLGFQTQKPIALLERILHCSCPTNGIILDPFCGCGTAIVAAQKLNRNWIGIDITHLAIGLIRNRLIESFGKKCTFKVIGEPTTAQDAQTLADTDQYQFQWWALGLVGARPANQKKGSDQGIDGRLFFHDDAEEKTKQVVISVKAGHNIGVSFVRDLRGVIEREKAEIGVLITMQEPTQPMRIEAAEAGFYQSPGTLTSYPRLQLLTISDLLGGRKINRPFLIYGNVTHRKAAKITPSEGEQVALGL